MLKKLVIIAIYFLVYYLIIEISYTRLLLIIKLIFIDIKFKFFKKTSCIYNNLAKLGRKTKLNSRISKHPKN